MKLRNLVLAMSFIAYGASVSAQSQPREEVKFNPHTYLQLQGGVGATLGEAKFSDLLSPAAAFSFGYQFSPVLGARLGISGWESRGGWVNPSIDYSYNYLAGNLDVTLNLSNLLCKFNPERVFNLSLFAGGAINYAFDNDEAERLACTLRQDFYSMPYLWHDSKVLIAGRMGIMADFRLSKRISLNLEANANVLSDRYNSKKANNADWYFNALAGLTFRLGKTTKKVTVAPVAVQPVTVTPTPAKTEVTKPTQPEQPRQTVEKKAEEYRCDVFFTLNSSVVRPEEKGKLAALAEYLKAHPKADVQVTGYADVQTGNSDINLRLSQQRAGEVSRLLVSEYGVAAARVTTAYKGDAEQLFSENDRNRVCICIVK